MSALQEQAVQMIRHLSDDNVSFLIEIIQRLMPQKPSVDDKPTLPLAEGMRVFERLNKARMEIRQYLPEGFDPDREREEALAGIEIRNLVYEGLQDARNGNTQEADEAFDEIGSRYADV